MSLSPASSYSSGRDGRAVRWQEKSRARHQAAGLQTGAPVDREAHCDACVWGSAFQEPDWGFRAALHKSKIATELPKLEEKTILMTVVSHVQWVRIGCVNHSHHIKCPCRVPSSKLRVADVTQAGLAQPLRRC